MKSSFWPRFTFPACALLLSLAAAPVQAGWPHFRIPICEAPAEQQSPASAPDGSGGVIIAWTDYRNGTADIFAQRVDGSGDLRWAAGGIEVCAVAGEQRNPAVIADGAGGVVVVWQDDRGSGQLRAARFDGSGVALWSHEVLVSSMVGGLDFTACADGAGGVLVSWQGYRAAASDTGSVGHPDVFAQRLDGAGARLWSDAGAVVCSAQGWQIDPTVVADGGGGAIVSWVDRRSDWDVYAQRVTSDGGIAWQANGVGLGTGPALQLYHDASADGAGGAIVAWSDDRGPEGYDIYAQRIDASGAILWEANGIGVLVARGSQHRPRVATDGAGGAIIACEDNRGDHQIIRAQRVNGAGSPRWSPHGEALGLSSGYQQAPRIVADGARGAFVVWEDARNLSASGWDLYGQHVDPDGGPLWDAEGASIEAGPGSAVFLALTFDGGAGAFLAWCHRANVSAWNIYARHVGEEASSPTRVDKRTDIFLEPARPNPAPDGATLRFSLARAAHAALTIHDHQGRLVRELMRGPLAAGAHTWQWDGRDNRGQLIPSGVYFVRLVADGESQSRTVTVMH
jgi:hypothetical protein